MEHCFNRKKIAILNYSLNSKIAVSQSMPAKIDTILVLDFGGQYCHLIGRRIREHGVYSEIVPHDVSPKEVVELQEKFNVKGLIFSGGPSSVYGPNAPKLHPRILEVNLPIPRIMLWASTASAGC